MADPVRYRPYELDTRCCVKDCTNLAEYEVYLYDYYEFLNKEFFEQDFTCPFICEQHMLQNEREIEGERIPRAAPRYPFTKRQWAQGYTKYAPISEIFPLLYSATSIPEGLRIVASLDAVNDELIAYLAKHPEFMYRLEPRRFEELVAELLRAQGFTPTLTPQTRDGGRDIIATRADALGDLLYLVECKRYAPNNKVGVGHVRGIYGVAQAERASKAVLVTTSTFTQDAVNFATPLKYDISLKDYEALKLWLHAASRR